MHFGRLIPSQVFFFSAVYVTSAVAGENKWPDTPKKKRTGWKRNVLPKHETFMCYSSFLPSVLCTYSLRMLKIPLTPLEGVARFTWGATNDCLCNEAYLMACVEMRKTCQFHVSMQGSRHQIQTMTDSNSSWPWHLTRSLRVEHLRSMPKRASDKFQPFMSWKNMLCWRDCVVGWGWISESNCCIGKLNNKTNLVIGRGNEVDWANLCQKWNTYQNGKTIWLAHFLRGFSPGTRYPLTGNRNAFQGAGFRSEDFIAQWFVVCWFLFILMRAHVMSFQSII